MARGDLIELLREATRRTAPAVPVTEIAPEADIAELGLTSIQLMEIVAELEDTTGVTIPDSALIAEVRTIDDLLGVVDRLRQSIEVDADLGSH